MDGMNFDPFQSIPLYRFVMVRTRTSPLLLLLSCLLLAPVAGAGVKSPCEKGRKVESGSVSGGIKLVKESCEEPLYRAFLVELDLDEPGYAFQVTPWKKRRRTTSDFADMYGALVAINGGFWGGEWGGFTVADGQIWAKGVEDLDTSTVVGFGGREKGRLRVEIRPTEEILTEPPKWMEHALTAIPTLLRDGEPVEMEIEHTLFQHKHPRTAIGLSKDGSTLLLVVIDGRQPGWSKGLRTDQVAALLGSHGAWNAANLDGGSSSTLVIPSKGGLVNDPCYKKADERNVPNHLGIVHVGKKKGKLARLLLRLLGLPA
jgi:hypothetical protein